MVKTVLQGQSLLDIAIQYCGDISAAVSIAKMNNISVTDDLKAGTLLTLPDTLNKRVQNYYTINRIIPATATAETTASNRVFNNVFSKEFS